MRREFCGYVTIVGRIRPCVECQSCDQLDPALAKPCVQPPWHQIHVTDHDFHDAGHPAFNCMSHLLHIMNALVIMVDDLGFDRYRICRLQLAQIGGVGFQREKGVVGSLHIIRPEAQCFKHLVRRPVEQYAVVGHVEMAVVINPLWLDLHDCGMVGRGHRNLSESW
jgi:hypothetical protein